MLSHYTEWKTIDTQKARRALDRGGKLFDLPTSFFYGGAIYRTALIIRSFAEVPN